MHIKIWVKEIITFQQETVYPPIFSEKPHQSFFYHLNLCICQLLKRHMSPMRSVLSTRTTAVLAFPLRGGWQESFCAQSACCISALLRARAGGRTVTAGTARTGLEACPAEGGSLMRQVQPFSRAVNQQQRHVMGRSISGFFLWESPRGKIWNDWPIIPFRRNIPKVGAK